MLDYNHTHSFAEILNDAVDAALVTDNATRPRRDYLGGSRVGHACERALQFEFAGAPKDDGADFSGRTLRIFAIGHVLEDLAIRWLRAAGIDLYTHKGNDPDGEQFGFAVAGGRIRGHVDGIVAAAPDALKLGVPALWECKTMNAKNWRACVKDEDLATLCRLRGDIAMKVAGDTHFRSAHQPIRVAGSVYHKGGFQRLVQIREHNAIEVDLGDFAERVAAMPFIPGMGVEPAAEGYVKPSLDAILTTPVHEGGQDAWTRFEGASAAIGHYVRMVHEGKLSPNDGWEAICQYNAAMLRPAWPEERLKQESERLWALHVKKNGPALLRNEAEIPALRVACITERESAHRLLLRGRVPDPWLRLAAGL